MLQDQRLNEVFNPNKAAIKQQPATKRRPIKHKTSIQTPDPPSDITDSIPDFFDSDSSDDEFLGFSAKSVVKEMPEFEIAQLEMEGKITLFEESDDDDEEEFIGFTEDGM